MNKFWRSLFAGLLAACGTFGFAMDDLTITNPSARPWFVQADLRAMDLVLWINEDRQELGRDEPWNGVIPPGGSFTMAVARRHEPAGRVIFNILDHRDQPSQVSVLLGD
jgi:hypothetical protein